MKAVKDVALKSPYIIYISPHFLYIHLQPPPIHFHVFVSNRGTSLPPLLSLLSSSPSDVCALVRRWEPGPHGAHLQTAKGEDPGHHWVVHPPVPRIPGALPQAHPYLPQILPSDEKRRFWGTRQQYICEYNVHTREYIYLKIYIIISIPPCCQIRPTPPHLTSAMAENILASACESETRNAAKRMRLDTYQATVNVLAAAVWQRAQQASGNFDDRGKRGSSEGGWTLDPGPRLWPRHRLLARLCF